MPDFLLGEFLSHGCSLGWLREAGPKGSASFAVYSLPDTVHNAPTMQIRYLVSIHEVNCAVPLRDHLSNLIATTAYIPDRNIYAANVTLAQWNKIREEYWATGRQCDHGRLVPSIDFVASDGKSFLDFEACRKHEESIATPKFNVVLMRDLAKRSEFIAAKICADVVQYNNGEFCNAATEHRFQEWLVSKPQEAQGADESHKLAEAGAVPAPATTPFQEALAGHKTPEEMGQSKAFAGQTPDVPQTLEDRMLVVVGSNYMNLSLVASLLKTDEDAVRAVAESSGKFKLSGSGKSIAKN